MTYARFARRLAGAAAVSIAFSAVAQAQTTDPVIFSFATVGDTRTDPTGFDPTTTVNPTATVACETSGCAISSTGSLLAQDARFLQNTKAWQRIIRTEQSRKPKLFFVNGDLIMGYGRATYPTGTSGVINSLATLKNSDVYKANLQYAYWRGMITPLLETGTMVLPVAGNHETQCSSGVTVNGAYNATTNPTGCYKPSSGTGKTAYAENETLWRDNMGDLIGNGQNQFQKITGFTPANWNGLTAATAPGASDTCPASDPATGAYGSCGAATPVGSDQSKLSYSFDIALANGKKLHFAVINTDPTGNDSHAPVNWLKTDFASAKTNGATNFFVFGHKPAFTYDYNTANNNGLAAVTGAGLDGVTTPPTVADFWKLIGDYNATYFCGHEHISHVQTYSVTGTDGTTKTPVQVLVGAGGSPWDYKPTAVTAPTAYQEPTLAATGQSQYDRYYGWADVQVHQSGAVTLSMSYFSDAFGPTITLSPLAGNLQ